jgi:hypothetical protein
MKYIFIVLSSVALYGCADEEGVNELADEDISYAFSNATAERIALEDLPQAPDPSAPPASIKVTRKLVKSSEIDFEVKDIHSTTTTIDSLTNVAGGYSSSHTAHDRADGPQVRQVIRVPSDKFDDFITKILRLSERIESKTTTAEDVSETVIDAESRVLTMKDLEKRYRKILTNAKTVEEMLDVERELGQVRSDIESLEARLHYLNNQVAFSTLTVSYHQVVERTTNPDFAARISRSLGDGWNKVLDVIVCVIGNWPGVTAGLVVFFFGYRWIRYIKEAISVAVKRSSRA